MNLRVLQYNNYYNRIVKKEDSLADYNSYGLANYTNVNYYPADGVNTQAIINDCPDIPDYCIYYDDEGNIVSRWFVIEALATRKKQISLKLHRDIVVDTLEAVKTAPMYIEKALLPADSPLIFNAENMTYNQIKQSETLLKDETGIGWVCAYIPRDAFKNSHTITETVYTHVNDADFTVDNILNWTYWKYATNNPAHVNPMYLTRRGLNVYASLEGFFRASLFSTSNADSLSIDSITPTQAHGLHFMFTETGQIITLPSALRTALNPLVDSFSFWSQLGEVIRERTGLVDITQPEYNTIINLNGKTIYDSNAQSTYKIKVEQYGISVQNLQGTNTAKTNTLVSIINQEKVSIPYVNTQTATYDNIYLQYSGYRYIITLEQVNERVDITPDIDTVRYHLSDAPYDMICFPYGDIEFKRLNDGALYHSNGDVSLQMAIALAKEAGASSVYDVQLLPYLPARNTLKEKSGGGYYIDLTTTSYNCIYPTGTTNNPKSFGIWCSNSSGTFNIPCEIEAQTDAIEKKVANETEKYRLCGPNYQSAFEFNPQMNDGLDYITVSYTYKPFNPYIHLAPNFKGLYSSGTFISQFNDLRGLTLQGDFSVTQLSNAWANYQQNNVNYNNIFNREIENIQVQHKYQRISEGFNIATGTLQGAVAGGTSGLMMGGPVGAVAGAAVGGVASVAGGIADYKINESLRHEALDYKQDMYGYQLGNIKAIPTALTKVTAFTIDNHIFPFLEKYDCTEIEKNALRDKIKYNGMTVGIISSIDEILTTGVQYIKGKLIRLENINEDFHMLNSLADELNKGVFING